MPSFPSPFGAADDDLFDDYDEFVAANLPRPGEFLDGHEVLTGADHLAFHRLTRECFEARTVYDMTFDYNLARLNLDTRHDDAGFRYAVERGHVTDAVDSADVVDSAGADADAFDGGGVDRVLRAEFTPTTAFCPQTHTLTIGAFRAWNGLVDRHEYDLVRVRAAPTHNQSEAVNERLAELETAFLETGDVGTDAEDGVALGSDPSSGAEDASAGGRSTDTPF
jgi:hypothetical protein